MFQKSLQIIKDGVGTAFPCAAVAIGLGDEVFAREFFGQRQIKPSVLPLTEDTLFDLASLSKLVSTTAIALKFIEDGKLSLDDKISKFFEFCGNYGDCTIKHLLTHTSGIPAWLPLFKMPLKNDNVLETIFSLEKSYETGTQVSYSCIGFIVLQKILEKVSEDTLDNLAEKFVFSPLGMKNACYNPNAKLPTAATEWYSGKAHDENALFLGGVSGNAGVFATLDDVICFAKMCSNKGENFISKEIFDFAIKNHTENLENPRGLGFNLDIFTPESFGHTGFTGTSLCVDKKTGLWGILLTNAVHFGRENRADYFSIRKEFYEMMLKEFKE